MHLQEPPESAPVSDRHAPPAFGPAPVGLAALAAPLSLLFLQDGAPGSFERVWTYVILHIDGEPVTVRKVVVGAMLLVFGFVASRVLSGSMRRMLPQRFKLTPGGAAALESVAFYVLLTVFSVSALAIAGVPLTAFTLLGGAAAIGIGFGSQTVVNNFISGLILLVERPIQVGNLVQIDDLYGTVERIGTRSTLVRTGDNVDIIVPNSSFLEQNVVNWTLTAPEVRIHVNVGVAYGSDTALVEEILLRAVTEDEATLKDRDPFVLFRSFGESSLDFEVHFWIRMHRVLDRSRAESRVRFRIDRLFRESDVVISFPQRDVHLDAPDPLEVRVLGAEASSRGKDGGA